MSKTLLGTEIWGKGGDLIQVMLQELNVDIVG
jgi:hypothetical protein